MMVSLAHELCDAGRIPEAEELSRWLIAEHPDFQPAQVALGRALFEEGRLDEAVDVLRKAVQAVPGSFVAYRWLGESLVRKGDWARARATLAQAVLLSPENRRIKQLLRLAGEARGTRKLRPAGDEPHTPPLAPHPAVVEATAQPAQLPPGPFPPLPESDDAALDPPTEPYNPKASTQPADRLPPLPESPPPEDVTVRITSELLGRPSSTQVVEPLPPTYPTLRMDKLREQPWRRLLGHRGPVLAGAAVMGLLVGAAGVAVHQISRRPTAPPSTIAGRPTTDVPRRSPRGAGEARARLERAAEDGSFAALTAVRGAGGVSASGAEAEIGGLFVDALLAAEYGVALPAEAQGRLAALERARLDAALADELRAARRLATLAGGALPDPVATAPTTRWGQYVEALLTARRGDARGARALLAPVNAAGQPAFSAAVLLEAELAIDAGNAAAAGPLAAAVLARAPGHGRAQIVAEQARRADGKAAVAPPICATPGLPPNPLAACHGLVGSALRQAGDRAAARAHVAAGARAGANDPRALAQLAQLAFNLGDATSGKALLNPALGSATSAFPPVAWSLAAFQLARGEPAQVPAAPEGPEARLVAARAAYAAQGEDALAAVVAKMPPDGLAADRDLRWFAQLPRFEPGKARARFASKLRTDAQELGPVGSYVIGIFAQGHRRLSAYWLERALDGHGDSCAAAARYAAVLADLGRPAQKDARLAALATPERCPRLATELGAQ